MFEQSVITTKKNPWTMALSLTLQSAVVGSIFLVSLFQIEAIGPISLPDPLPPLPRFEAIKIIASQVTISKGGVTNSQPRVFVAPSRIPMGVNTSPEPAVEMPAVGMVTAGVQGTGVPGALPGLGTAIEIAQPPPPPPAAVVKKPMGPIRVGGSVLAARIVERAIPPYPALAKLARVQGRVQLLGVIARDGTVKNLQVVSGHPLLVTAALEAVRRWRYEPTLLNGDPVEVAAPIEVNFTLAQ